MDPLDVDLEKAETQADDELYRRQVFAASSSQTNVGSPIPRQPTHEDTWHSQILRHTHTVGSTPFSPSATRASEKSLPLFGAGKPYPPEIPAERAAYVVDFNGPDDTLHPLNWPSKKKLVNATIGAFACLCSTFASAVFSPATGAVAKEFHVSVEVASLSSTLYLLGYGIGPAIFGPLSELRGRKLPILIGSLGFSIFAIAVAVSKDLQTLMISRFFMGVFGSSPLSVVAAQYSDMYRAEQRGIALVVFACAVFMGPMVAPFIGAFTAKSYLGWRFDSYWSMIMGFVTFACAFLFMSESYAPAVLISKAEQLRRITKNWAIHAKQEEIEIDLREMLQKNVTRPARMLITDPILLLVGIYLSFVYGLMYICLAAFPLIFQGVHHMSAGVGSLPLFGMALGMLLSGVASIAMNPAWVRKYKANNNRAVPEWRLPLAAYGAFVFPIGLFWLGWTGYYESVHWIVPTIAGVFVGFGLLAIFMQLNMYLIDSYLMFAASAIAGNTMIRSLFAAACPLFDRQMFENMGINWAATLLGCLALLLAPVPIAFMLYGKKLREKSKFAPILPPPGATQDSEKKDVSPADDTEKEDE